MHYINVIIIVLSGWIAQERRMRRQNKKRNKTSIMAASLLITLFGIPNMAFATDRTVVGTGEEQTIDSGEYST